MIFFRASARKKKKNHPHQHLSAPFFLFPPTPRRIPGWNTLDKTFTAVRRVTTAAAFDDGNCILVGSNDGAMAIIDTRNPPREGPAMFWKTPYIQCATKVLVGRG